MTPLTPDINLGRLFTALIAERDMALAERDRSEQRLGVLTMRHLELIGIIKALGERLRQVGEPPTEQDYTETMAMFCRMAETALHHYGCLLDDEAAAG
jgi:hypothetical protein